LWRAKDGYDTPGRLAKLAAAVEIAQLVINDPEYQQAMRAYPGTHDLAGFTQATEFVSPNKSKDVSSNDEPMDTLLADNGADRQIHL